KNGETPVHQRLLEKLCGIDINDLKCNDPLSNGVIGLGSDRFEISENDFDLLVGEKAGIRRLSKSASIKNICAEFVRRRDEFQKIYKLVIAEDVNVVHYRWVEQESEREQIVRDITECLMQLIKSNSFRRVSRGSENSLVEVVARLIEVATYKLPINREVEVTRNERQSVASKNRKARVKEGARGNRPDLMIRALLDQKWNEIVYAESGKWNCNKDKILEDHKKLVRFCIDGYKEVLKKHVKDILRKNYIAFRINIAENRVKYYLPISKAKILLGLESVKEVEEFVYTLMTIQPGDKGKDIICEVYGFIFVIQCKAWYKRNIDRLHVDELETVIRRENNLNTVVRKGRFSFGILVGVEEDRISDEAIERAISSECDIG
ncbi:601_t:CDS:2, partial [Racocetra persica]